MNYKNLILFLFSAFIFSLPTSCKSPTGTGTNEIEPALKEFNKKTPIISPDGKKIMFSVFKSLPTEQDSPNFGIYVTNIDDGKTKKIFDVPSAAPVWLSDSDTICLVSYDDKTNLYNINTIKSDGTGLKKIIDINGFNINAPIWNKAMNKFLISEETSPKTANDPLISTLFLINAQTKEKIKLTESKMVPIQKYMWLSSRQDKNIIFTKSEYNENEKTLGDLNLYMVNEDGSELKKLFNLGSNDFDVSNEEKIVFSDTITEKNQGEDFGKIVGSEIFITDFTGVEKKQLSKSSFHDIKQNAYNYLFNTIPKWNKNGTKILFTSQLRKYFFQVKHNSEPDKLVYELNVINSDGSGEKRLTDSKMDGWNYQASWLDKKIIFSQQIGDKFSTINILDEDLKEKILI
jgi:Tol biopolymer transport system component